MATFRSLGADIKILVGSLVLIALLSIITVLTAPAPEAPALSIRNDKASGAMALHHWLQKSGYEVHELLSLSKDIYSVDVLFVLEPIIHYDDGDIRLIRDWVRQGNTLIITGSPYNLNDLLEPYEISMDYHAVEIDAITAAAPTLLRPTFDLAAVEVAYPISTEQVDAVPHLFVDNFPVLVSLQVGEGEIWVAGIPVPFTNRGIQDRGNAKIIANLLAKVPSNASIGFDEAAHGYGEETALDFNGWLFGTPPGWGILLGTAITLLYLALRGRRFARPIPLPDDRLRRESGEYIQAMAALFRRSGQRSEMLKHYESQLRRNLSERYALDPNLEPNELVKTVIYNDPSIDEAAFRSLLTRLRRDNVNEAELVRTVTDVDTFLRQIQQGKHP